MPSSSTIKAGGIYCFVVTRKVIIPSAIIGAVLLAAAYRFVQIAPYPQGGGRYEESPNKQFTADAFNLTDRSFFGGEKSFYEFTIKSRGQQIRHVVMEQPREEMIQWRDEGTIQWAPDNSTVTYSFNGMQLVLSLKL